MSASATPGETSQKATRQPSQDEIDELLLCARYGDQQDLNDMKAFVDAYGATWLADAQDDNGNTCLHLAGANGHVDIVSYLLQHVPQQALTKQNKAQSTPLHWISINFHLQVLELLCPKLSKQSFNIQNLKGKTALQEAEEATESFIVPQQQNGAQGPEVDVNSPRAKERVKREKVVGYLLQCMGLGVKEPSTKLNKDGDDVNDHDTTQDAGKTDQETMQRLTKEAERIKLEQQQ
ncbi:hypothetical protein OIO90_002958 [Microbotryomycetes sp. JL221]|nr:hypothetical protein OIO90_002958 [Microbotryomycetes sp. JL221]